MTVMESILSTKFSFFFFQAEDGIRDYKVTGVQTCALPISPAATSGRDASVACRHGSGRACATFPRRAAYSHATTPAPAATPSARVSRASAAAPPASSAALPDARRGGEIGSAHV